ncbi:FecR/PupR family sigma factor regulator [Planctomicrobium sp. SH664]|uniref:FecR/PupR family sigma factor regulator n=1 Tax=Planctomicrobium sp. SH664 TaxID=3448125 RepID=UPI003F5C2EA4
MREQEALELLDAHLDEATLTEQQVEELSAWLRANPQHAERAFHRIFLHSFLRRRLQAQKLPVLSNRTDLIPLDVESEEFNPTTELFRPAPAELQIQRPQASGFSRFLVAGLLLLGGIGGSWLLKTRAPLSVPVAAVSQAYDGFEYPASSIPAPAPEAQTWPTSGGLQGLQGGHGWSGPWEETGPKVSVIVDHVNEMNWPPKDMRKFKPLSHRDPEGRELQTSGLQMRTAMGARSLTSRKLNLSAFPESMIDAGGLGKDGSVIWISFLAQSYNSTAENNRFAYFQIGSREVSGYRLGKVGAAPSGNWTATGLLTGAQVNLRSSAVPSGEMAFLVTRLEFRPGTEDASVWINPGLAAEPKAGEATLRLEVPDFRFDGITVNANFSTDFDEIRIGDSFRSVAPLK